MADEWILSSSEGCWNLERSLAAAFYFEHCYYCLIVKRFYLISFVAPELARSTKVELAASCLAS